jgi:hypothetical protein
MRFTATWLWNLLSARIEFLHPLNIVRVFGSRQVLGGS